MARYTDIDKLIAEYDRVHVGAPGGARKLMVEAPIADVVPRAEVAREIFEELEKYMMNSVDVTHTAYKTIGTATFAILKKKYTGDKNG